MSVPHHRQHSFPAQPPPPSRSTRPTAYIPRSSPLAGRALDTTTTEDDNVPKTRTGAKPSRISSPTEYPTPPQTPSPNGSKPELPPPSSKSILVHSPTEEPTQLPTPPLSPRSSSSNLKSSLHASSTRSSRTRSPFAAPPVFKAYTHREDAIHHVRWSDETTAADTQPTHRRASTAPNPATAGSSTSSRRPSAYVPIPIHGNIPTLKTKAKPASEDSWLTATGPPAFTRAWTPGIVMPAKAKGSSTGTGRALKPSASTSNVLSETAAFNANMQEPRPPLHLRRAASELGALQPRFATMPASAGHQQALSLWEMITAEEAQMGLEEATSAKSEFGLDGTAAAASVKNVGNKGLKKTMSLGKIGKIFGLAK